VTVSLVDRVVTEYYATFLFQGNAMADEVADVPLGSLNEECQQQVNIAFPSPSLRYTTVKCGESKLTFRPSIWNPSSLLKSNLSKKPA
jgi:hypothetical protein